MSEVELPPLPEPTFEHLIEMTDRHDMEKMKGHAAYARAVLAEFLPAYATAAVLAERERCAKIAKHLNGWGSVPCPELADHIAAVIRKG